MKKYKEMRDYLDELEDKIFSKWTLQVPEKCASNLDKSLMIQAEDTLELSLNFDDEVRLTICVRIVPCFKVFDKVSWFSIEVLDLYLIQITAKTLA
jgi:hypothetical protein